MASHTSNIVQPGPCEQLIGLRAKKLSYAATAKTRSSETERCSAVSSEPARPPSSPPKPGARTGEFKSPVTGKRRGLSPGPP